MNGLRYCKFCGAGFYTDAERAGHEPRCRPWELDDMSTDVDDSSSAQEPGGSVGEGTA